MTDTLINIDKEKIVIGCCLNDDTCIKTAMTIGLKPKAFTDGYCMSAFETMVQMIHECVKIDILTVSARLQGYFDFLAECANLAVSYTILFDENVSDLMKLAAIRDAYAKIDVIKAEILEKPLDINTHLQKIDGMSKTLSQSALGHGMSNAEDAAREYFDMITSDIAYQNIPLLKGLKKSIFHRGETFVLGADTGKGKTAFAAGAVNLMLDQGFSVLYCCAESSKAEIMGRLVSARCDINHKRFIDRAATQAEWQAHNLALQELAGYKKKLGFHCLEDGIKMTPRGVASSIKQLTETAGHVDVVVIDYLQRFHANYVKPGTSKTLEITDVIEGLHDIFLTNKTAGLVLCQYQREGQKASRDNNSGAPQLNWLKDCGEIENQAHVVAHIVVKQKNEKQFTWELVCNQKARNVDPFRILMRRTGATFEVDTTQYASAEDVPSEF